MSVGNLQGSFALARPMSFVFPYHPFGPEEIRFLCMFTKSLYAIMNPEFMNSLEHT